MLPVQEGRLLLSEGTSLFRIAGDGSTCRGTGRLNQLQGIRPARNYTMCAELGITRQTLYRHVDPKGGLRPVGKKLLGARTTAEPVLAYI